MLRNGHFSPRLQIARVAVIYKKGSKNDFGNYRPISILPVFSKVFEKLILKRVESFLNKHSILSDNQYGFRKNRSTELALLHQKEYILRNFEHRNLVLGIFLDYSKAFDCINHSILFQKLECYGIRGAALLLIKSYLSHRRQYVQINEYKSTLRTVSCGVPQGSILGPLLFNLYINDIVSVDTNVRFIIYADDTSLFLSDDSSSKLRTNANVLLEKYMYGPIKIFCLLILQSQRQYFFVPKIKNAVISVSYFITETRLS